MTSKVEEDLREASEAVGQIVKPGHAWVLIMVDVRGDKEPDQGYVSSNVQDPNGVKAILEVALNNRMIGVKDH